MVLNPPASSLFFSTNDVTAGSTRNSNLTRTIANMGAHLFTTQSMSKNFLWILVQFYMIIILNCYFSIIINIRKMNCNIHKSLTYSLRERLATGYLDHVNFLLQARFPVYLVHMLAIQSSICLTKFFCCTKAQNAHSLDLMIGEQ